jgi:hypothetical protein
MKCGIGAALAVGAGYVLGRRRKMRTAAMLAGATAVGGIGGLGGSALRRGVKALGSSDLLDNVSPQLGDIADKVRGDLVDAAKAAAVAAVTGRIESLTDSLQERTGTLRAPAEQAAGKPGETAEGLRRRARPARPADQESARGRARKGRGRPEDGDSEGRDSEDREPEDRDEFEDEDEDADEFEDTGEFDDTDEPEDDDEPEDEDKPEPARGRRRAPRGRAPVSRASSRARR